MTKKLLAVDDDPVVLRYIDLIFSEKGFDVVTAEDGLAALDVLEIYTPDVILVDMVMPNIDGKKLCKILRGMRKLKDTYLIALSATVVEEGIKASDLGVDAIIAKGAYEETTQHILAAIEQPEVFASRCKSGEVIGIENVYPRRVTKELLYVKKHFEVVIDKISEGVLEFGPKGRVLYANLAALSIIALPEEKLLGRNFAELFPAPHRREILTLFEELDKGAGTIGEQSPMTLNARLLTMDIVPVEKDGSRAVAILRDITERKQVEGKLKEREAELQMANKELELLSNIDGLTSLYNRRFFDRALNREWKRHQRSGFSLSLLLCDIDYFKNFNDSYGHQVGDECLRDVAEAITMGSGRSSDVAARYGGEEFVVILPETGAEGALKAAEIIRWKIRELNIPHKNAVGRDMVTASFGVATMIPERDTEPSNLVNLADRALYRSKEAGRDRVTAWPVEAYEEIIKIRPDQKAIIGVCENKGGGSCPGVRGQAST